MNSYEQRLEARRLRLEARADRLRKLGEGRVARAHEMASIIPFGQPILVGHHSEKADRSYRGKIENNFRKGFEAMAEADKVAGRAASVGEGGVSADDPDAVAKLREQLARIEADQQRMKACNALIRRHKGEAAIPHLVQQGIPEKAASLLIQPDACGRIGFADYQLQNNGANIRRIKARIEQLGELSKRVAKAVEREDGIRIVENVEANRLQLIFPGKPAPALIAELKSRGFRWAPSEGAWQRQLNNAALYAAQCVMRMVDQ